MSLEKEILEKIKKLAYQNAFNDKQTKDFIDLVNSGTNIDKAIEIIEKGDLPKKISAKTYESGIVGTEASRLVLEFLKTSSQHKLTAYTYTEIFAFVYFAIDYIIFARKISARASIAESMSRSYSEIMQRQFGSEQKKEHLAMFDQRIQEYGTMSRSRKKMTDIVEKLDFYLNQSSGLDGYHRDGESPVVVGDALAMLGSSQALTDFYTETLAPFIKSIIEKHQ